MQAAATRSDFESGKKKQVTKMFDDIAARYDFLNRLLSFRMDVLWRKAAVKVLKTSHPDKLLDVATGTGDLAFEALRQIPGLNIVGIDPSQAMLALASQKIAGKKLAQSFSVKQGSAEAMPFSDASFNAVTIGFGVRNFNNLPRGLSHVYRVLKPGGMVVILEFSKPKLMLFRMFYGFYFRSLVPIIAWIFAGNKQAYQYLPASVQTFPSGKDFTDLLAVAGFIELESKMLSGGICTVYTARKAA